MAGALPLPTGTQKWLGRAVFLITHIPAVIVPITEPVSEDAVSIGTEETRGRTSSGGTATVLIRSSEAVWVPIALPAIRNADAIFSALEFILAAHPGRPGWTIYLIRVVTAVRNTITSICVANTFVASDTFELRISAINYTSTLIRPISTVLIPITDKS